MGVFRVVIWDRFIWEMVREFIGVVAVNGERHLNETVGPETKEGHLSCSLHRGEKGRHKLKIKC